MKEYSIGEYIIYRNGEKYELGRIKSLREDGAFVAYHEGETGAKTPYDCMHKLINGYCIKETLLGGDYFRAEQPEPQKKCFECDDFFTCDGQCDEVGGEPLPEREGE